MRYIPARRKIIFRGATSLIVVYGLTACGIMWSTFRASNTPSVPIQFVQSSAMFAPGGAQTTGASTFPVSPSSGNTIVVTLITWDSVAPTVFPSGTTVVDNQGNTYFYATSNVVNTAGFNYLVAIYYAKNILASGGPFTVTANFPLGTGAGQVVFAAAEFSGLSSNSPLDQTGPPTPAPAFYLIAPGNTTPLAGLQGVTQFSKELLVALFETDGGADITITNLTPTPLYNPIFTQIHANTIAPGQGAYAIVSSPSLYSTSWSISAGAQWVGCMASFH